MNLARRLFNRPALQLSVDDALKVAQAECSSRGWPCYNPKVRQGLGHYRVTFFRGPEVLGYGFVLVDGVTGGVLKAQILPR